MNIERSRRDYLNLRAQQEALRRKYLETTGRILQWQKEKQKRQFKCCNSTFRKHKLKAINRVEYRERGELIQVSTKNEVENAIMKENSSRFRLAYSTLILDDNICEELDPSGESKLSQEILNSQEQLHNHPEVQEIFKLFHHSQRKTISTHITTDQWIEH